MTRPSIKYLNESDYNTGKVDPFSVAFFANYTELAMQIQLNIRLNHFYIESFQFFVAV